VLDAPGALRLGRTASGASIAFVHILKEPRRELAQPNNVGQRFFERRMSALGWLVAVPQSLLRFALRRRELMLTEYLDRRPFPSLIPNRDPIFRMDVD
jgi:hypothetical protein